MFANPKLEAPAIDRLAYVFCVLESLHDALRRRDVYAAGSDKWADPHVHLIEPRLWVRERDTVLTALGLPADPAEHLADLADLLDGADKQVGAGLASDDAARIKDGKLSLARLEAVPVAKQADIGITAGWGGGLVASTDGLRFVVPVRSLHARPSPLYFGIGKRPHGTTWLNTVPDKVMGLGGLVVPGTLRDSMHILDAIHRLDATEPPEIVTTDTGSYSDVVYGMFAICGYQFAPRHADITDTYLWWVDTAMLRGEITRDHRSSNGWGAFNELRLRRVSIPAIVQYWDDMIRVAGSLSTNKVRAYDLIKMMTAGGRLTGLGNAFAAYGRIFKTPHLLQIIHVESYRRMIGTQLNTGESRHQLARRVSFGNLGQLRQAYERGMENQLGTLGLGLNAIIFWNSLYIDAAVARLEASGLGISHEIKARLSPLLFEHLNFHGSYPFHRPQLEEGVLRDLRDPNAVEDEPEE